MSLQVEIKRYESTIQKAKKEQHRSQSVGFWNLPEKKLLIAVYGGYEGKTMQDTNG